MSACAPRTYTNVSPAAWFKITGAVQADYGVDITDYVGDAAAGGFKFGWAYDPARHTLVIQCLDSPWEDPCSAINATIDRLIQPFLGTA